MLLVEVGSLPPDANSNGRWHGNAAVRPRPKVLPSPTAKPHHPESCDKARDLENIERLNSKLQDGIATQLLRYPSTYNNMMRGRSSVALVARQCRPAIRVAPRIQRRAIQITSTPTTETPIIGEDPLSSFNASSSSGMRNCDSKARQRC